jgi:hypothetical protein
MIVRRRAQPRRERPTRARFQRRQARHRGDLVQPPPYRGPALEPVQRAPRSQVGLLHQVLGVVDRAEHPVAVRQQLRPEPLDEGGELGVRRHRGFSRGCGDAHCRAPLN